MTAAFWGLMIYSGFRHKHVLPPSQMTRITENEYIGNYEEARESPGCNGMETVLQFVWTLQTTEKQDYIGMKKSDMFVF